MNVDLHPLYFLKNPENNLPTENSSKNTRKCKNKMKQTKQWFHHGKQKIKDFPQGGTQRGVKKKIEKCHRGTQRGIG